MSDTFGKCELSDVSVTILTHPDEVMWKLSHGMGLNKTTAWLETDCVLGLHGGEDVYYPMV